MKLTISIHAPPRGATRRPQCSSGTAGYFNSRPSARGDPDSAACCCRILISIHAPPRGATQNQLFYPAQVSLFQFTPLREGRQLPLHDYAESRPISIHAPPRGATRRGRLPLQKLLNFNSRPSARGDANAKHKHRIQKISIHAPPRGATTGWSWIPSRGYFNSRPSARGD